MWQPDEPRGYDAKWNKSDRERQIQYYFTYMWDPKNKANEQTKQNQTGQCKEQPGGCQRGRGGRGA